MSILVFGSNGQIGSALIELLGDDAIAINRDICDLADPNQILECLDKNKPKAIINAAAYTNVDQAEDEETLCNIINAYAPSIMARFAEENNIPMLHYSTDYVFSGNGDKPFIESDTPFPLNAYGSSKAKSETKLLKTNANILIFRTSWVYNFTHKNFYTTILRLCSEREELKIVDDQIGSPSFAPDIAKASIEVLNQSINSEIFPSGIYHLTNKGEVSWYDFAKEIVIANNLPTKILPIPSKEYPTKAKRPKNSRLDCSKIEQVFGISLPSYSKKLKND